MTPTTKTRLLMILPFAAVAGAALAQDVMIDPAIDVNGDGMYSFVELSAMYPEYETDAFTLADANGDGLLDLEELTAATEAGTMPTPTE